MNYTKERTLEIDNPESSIVECSSALTPLCASVSLDYFTFRETFADVDTTLWVMRRSTTDPVIFSRRESTADEILPAFLNEISVDDKGIGVELDSQNRVSISRRSTEGELREATLSPVITTSSLSHSHVKKCACSWLSCCPCYPSRPYVLDPIEENRICLVLDLDETLVHSSFTPMTSYDFVIPIKLGGVISDIYVLKRPGLDDFLRAVSLYFEYANPLLDLLDPQKCFINFRLYREHCVFTRGNFVKDLRILGRDLRRTLIVDNSPFCYMLQPENAVACSTFIDDTEDSELIRLSRFLLGMYNSDDVTRVLPRWESFV